jgi:dephospho-CoA kinase
MKDWEVPEELLGRYEEIYGSMKRLFELRILMEEAETSGDTTLLETYETEMKELKAIIYKKGLSREERKMERKLLAKAKFTLLDEAKKAEEVIEEPLVVEEPVVVEEPIVDEEPVVIDVPATSLA